MRSLLPPRLVGVLLAIQLPAAVGAALLHDGDDGPTAGGDVATESTLADDPAAERAMFNRLAEAADQTATATHYRYEMSMDLGAEGESLSAVLASGERAGDRERYLMDQSELLSGIGPVPTDVDLTMEVITDPTAQYIRAPLFGFIADGAEEAGDVLPPFMQELVELGDRWGRIDLSSLGSATGIPSDFMSQSTIDPASAVEMIRAASGTEEEAGAGDVRDVAVTDYAVSTTLGELGEGLDPEELAAFMPLPSDVDEELYGQMLDAMFDATLDLTVSIDDEGYVRRFVMDMRKLMTAVAEELGEPGAMRGFTMSQTVEFFDYDDQSIVIEVPPTEETVDLTPWALEIADAFS